MHELLSSSASLAAQARDELLDRLLDEEDANAPSPALSLMAEGAPPILSFAQQRLWFFEQSYPGSPTYTVPWGLALQGRLNREALRQSLIEIAHRHEPLRTTFPLVNQQPVQFVHESQEIDLPLVDLRLTPENDKERTALYLAGIEAARPFDLQTGPLFRAQLICLAPGLHWLVMSFHHIIFDGWSKTTFLQELEQIYSALAAGKAVSLPAMPLRYLDFTHWQRQQLQMPGHHERLQSYWQRQLEDSLTTLDLPADRPRPEVQNYRGQALHFVIPDSLSQALRQVSQREGVTLFMTLLAAFNVLLHRYSQQSDILVGTPIANRTLPEWEPMVGFFINMLAIRTKFNGGLSFSNLLRQVRQTTLDAYDHQDLPFEQVVELRQPQRDPSRSPLFQVAFVFQNTPPLRLQMDGLTGTSLRIPLPVSKFDLTLELMDEGQSLDGYFEYNTDLFDLERIERLRDHWLALLEQITRSTEQSLATISFLTRAEQNQLVAQWNATTTALPALTSYPDLFEQQAARTPEALALLFEQTALTYRELDQRANQLAHYLQSLQIGPGKVVGLYLDHSPEAIIGILGIWKAGGTYLPLDPALPDKRLAYILETAQPAAILTEAALAEKLPVEATRQIHLDTLQPRIAEEMSWPPARQLSPQNIAYIIFTSGSTGKPKGVALEHRGLVNLAFVQGPALGIGHQSRVLQFASLSFDASIWEIAITLAHGACLCLGRQPDLFPGNTLLNLMHRQAVTHLTTPPSVLEVLNPEDLPPGRVIISAGEALSAATGARWAARHRLINAYGPTEATVCSTMIDYQANMPVTIGHPIANARVYLLDAYLQPVPIGVSGELCSGGPGVAQGYLHQAALTAEKFIPDPFSSTPGERLYRTGDLARYRADGSIEFLGRIDQQLKIRGYRVEVTEIEVVLNQHPSVLQSAVRAYTHARGDIALAAYVVLNAPGANTDTSFPHSLPEYLRQFLPDYMIPTEFIVLEALPITSSGKIDRQALPLPDMMRPAASQATYLPPQTQMERLIGSIWQEALQVDQVGLHDNFFDLGGHSLLAALIQQQLQDALQREISLLDLFKHPTVYALAQALSTQATDEPDPAEALPIASQRTSQLAQMRQQRQTRTQSRVVQPTES